MLDTAVLITALRSANGAAAEILNLILHRRIVLLMDYKLACEYRDVALRPQHLRASGLTTRETERLIQVIENIAEPIVVHRKYRPLSSDPDDDMVLDVAINGHADAIVTNNVKHLRNAAEGFGIGALTPFQLLGEFRTEDGNDA